MAANALGSKCPNNKLNRTCTSCARTRKTLTNNLTRFLDFKWHILYWNIGSFTKNISINHDLMEKKLSDIANNIALPTRIQNAAKNCMCNSEYVVGLVHNMLKIFTYLRIFKCHHIHRTLIYPLLTFDVGFRSR